jgi:cytochrome c biogenesis protein CcdA
VVVASLTTAGASGMALMFGSYAAGMAVVLMSVALGAALFKGIVAQWFRRLLPYMNTVGALLLIIAGIYLVWFQARYLPLILATF